MSPGASPHPGRAWPVTALVLAVSWVVVCGLVVGWGRLLTHPLAGSVGVVDDDLARWFSGRRTPSLDELAEAGTFVGDTVTGLVVLAAVALGAWLWTRSGAPALFVLVTYAGLGGIYLVATRLDPRQRPPVTILDKGLIPDHSFPSGHVGTATAIAGCVIVLTWTYARAARWWTLALLVVPLWTLVARLYQGAHHLSDVLTSLVCAVVWLAVVATVLLPRGAAGRARQP